MDWITAPPTDLERAIAEFKARLPGWWFSTGECSVSCDASCGPDSTGPDQELLRTAPNDQLFDGGFHADLPQPSSLADALRDVMRQALDAKRMSAAGWTHVGPGVLDTGIARITVMEPFWAKA